MWDIWPVLVVGIVVAYCSLKYRETFVVKYGNPFSNEGEDLISFDRDAKGTRLFSITPNSCDKSKSDLDAGLCYTPCEIGYNGVGPVCWAQTQSVGIGIFPKLMSCPESGYAGWADDGLLCRQPIRCATGLAFFREGCSGGRIRPKNLRCETGKGATHPDNVTGLCYRRCPVDKPNRVKGMPYLCFKDVRGLSYGRGVGTVPPLFRFGE